MMKLLSDIRFYLVVIVTFFLTLLINDIILKDKIINVIKQKHTSTGDIEKANLQQKIDSLESELFVQQTIVGRYEIALEILKEKDSKAAEMYELILTTQTE